MESCTTETKKRPSEEPGPLSSDGVVSGDDARAQHRSKKPTIRKPTSAVVTSQEDPQVEMQALWEQQRQKDAQILVLQKKLSHYRSWITSLQNKVQQQNPQALKNAKRLYIGGFHTGTTEEDLRLFLSQLLKQTGGCSQPGNAIISVKIMKDKNFAFAEFRSVEETANTTAFDGVVFETSRLKIRRPSNYDVGSAILLGPVTPDPTMDLSSLDICRSTVDDSPHKLFIGGLPYDYNEEQVRDLVGTYAAVRSFNLVMDRTTGKSKGYAFCELMDESMTDVVIQQLNTYKLGNKLLTVKRAMEGGRNTNSQMLQSMLNPVQSPTSFSVDMPHLYSSGSGHVSGLHQGVHSGSYGGYNQQNLSGAGGASSLMMSPTQTPMTGLSGMNVGSSSSMLGGTPMSNGSMQANNMLSQLIGAQQSSFLSQQPSMGSLSGGGGGGEGIPVPDAQKSMTNAFHGSFGTPGGGIPGSYNSLGGGSLHLGPQQDLKVDPDICHSFDQSLARGGSTFLSQNNNLDAMSWKFGKQ